MDKMTEDAVGMLARALPIRGGKDVVIRKTATSPLFDCIVIVTCMNSGHMDGLLSSTRNLMKGTGLTELHVEGRGSSEWVALDYGTVVIHLFQEDLRSIVRLERLWPDQNDVD